MQNAVDREFDRVEAGPSRTALQAIGAVAPIGHSPSLGILLIDFRDDAVRSRHPFGVSDRFRGTSEASAVLAKADATRTERDLPRRFPLEANRARDPPSLSAHFVRSFGAQGV